MALPPVLDGLNERAAQLALPLVYREPHAVAWAVVCQLFFITQTKAGGLGRIGFSVMQIGFGKVLGPKGFVETAFQRIIGNIHNPAFGGRASDDSIVDTFLANGLKLIDENHVDPAADEAILSTCLQDRTMHDLGGQACRARPDLWDETVEVYTRRRPGWFRRSFSDPHGWLFD